MNSNGEIPPLKRDLRNHPGCGCAMTAALVIVWLAGSILIEFLFSIAKGTDEIMGPDLALASFIYAFVFASGFWALWIRKGWLDELGLRWNRLCSPHWIGGTIIGALGVGIALFAISIPGAVRFAHGPPAISGSEEIGTFSWFWSIFIFAVYAGEEEIIVRGMIYPLLRRSMGVIISVILSSLIFSSFHFFNNAFSTIPFLDILLAGVFLALMRELTGNLWLAWGAHFGWNFGLVALGLPVSGFIARLEPQTWHVVTRGPAWITGGAFGPEGGLGGIIADLTLVIIFGALVALKIKKNKKNQLHITEPDNEAFQHPQNSG